MTFDLNIWLGWFKLSYIGHAWRLKNHGQRRKTRSQQVLRWPTVAEKQT